MNKTNDGSRYGITQYRWPLDYELAGREFTLRSEKAEYRLRFQDREFTECNGVLSQYEALKIDDDTHIVFFGETISTAVLDLKNGTAAVGGDDGKYDFCLVEGFAASAALPGYTDEMTGTHVRWYFGSGRYLEHEYTESGKCRCTWSPRTERPRTRDAVCVKISEGKYLTEINGTSPFRTDMPQGFSKLILLQDYDKLMTVGCIYSPVLNEFRLISGYAMDPA